MVRTGLVVGLGLGLMAASPAWACGGLFCGGSTQRVDQSKERILFGKDPDGQHLSMHVQIAYEGDASRFAWVVPVPGTPDVAVGSNTTFNLLSLVSEPRFRLEPRVDGTCVTGSLDTGIGYETGWRGGAGGGGGAPGGGTGAVADTAGSVEVVASGQTGPYDWTLVDASTKRALLDWLADPDGNPATEDAYFVPDGFDDAVAPYVAGGSNFLAVKLSKDATTGEIVPLVLRFDGTQMTIPITLTAIAALPDMRLEVYVLGDQRGVPDNYLHVAINEARVNWFGRGTGWEALITEAANEAGGQAFATDAVLPSSTFERAFWQPGMFDLTALNGVTEFSAYMQALMNTSLAGSPTLLTLLQVYAPLPDGLPSWVGGPAGYYNCFAAGGCDLEPPASFDAAALTAALEARIVQPAKDAQALFDANPFVTRLTSSISPAEMTVDPVFVLNDTLTTDVPREHVADLVTDCTSGTVSLFTAPRRIELASGTVVPVPSRDELRGDARNWVPDVVMPAAARIDDLGATGTGVVLVDNGDAIVEALASLGPDGVPGEDTDVESADDALTDGSTGGKVRWCGCDGGGSGAGVAAALAAGVGLRRRRRAR